MTGGEAVPRIARSARRPYRVRTGRALPDSFGRHCAFRLHLL